MSDKYGVILADPPWGYSRNNGSGVAENHYTTMTRPELLQMPVEALAQDDAIMLMWTTWAFLPFALTLVDSWGFAYKTGMPWIKIRDIAVDLWGETHIKPHWGVGFWTRACTEILLINVRGVVNSPVDPPLGLMGDRFEHSRKPETVYEYAELFSGPYLELFARRPRPGWSVWGNEVESNVALPLLEVN